MIARVGVLGVVLIGALLVRTVLLPAIAVAGVVPDPVLLTVVGVALADGRAAGARYGFAAGLAVDLLAGPGLPVGTWSLSLCLAGYGVGVVRTYLTGPQLVAEVLAATAAAVAAIASAGVLGMLLDTSAVTPLNLLRAAVGTAAYNVAFVPVVVPAVMAVARRWSATPAVPA